MPHRELLPRSTPSDAGVSSQAIGALIDRLAEKGVETHSLMVVRHGQVVAEAWWAPYSAEQPHLLYSLTKSFTAMAVGLAIEDGVLSLDDRIVDVLPDHVPADASDQARRLTVHHLLSMTAGHEVDSLEQAWTLEPHDLVRGFLRVPTAHAEGTVHTYDNATTFLLARMVERATGETLPDYLDERLFAPMGIEDAEWDRVASGAAFGFHGLHLRTEAIAAFGELLLREGRWGDRQLIPKAWVEQATRSQTPSRHYADDAGPDFLAGYGYQIWMSRHGFHGNGAFGQHCIVVPDADLVVAVTSAQHEVRQAQDVLDAVWDCLLPGIDAPDDGDADLAERLVRLSLPVVPASDDTTGTRGTIAASALPDGTVVEVEPVDGGWTARFGDLFQVEIGHGRWRQSSPLGRPVAASGGWVDGTFVADLYPVATPHRLRLTVDPGIARLAWDTVPLTSGDVILHLRNPLMTRPDVS